MPSHRIPVNLFWFRRDLRLHDNAGLLQALRSDRPVLPVFIFDRNILDHLEDVDVFVIGTGDGDFVPLIKRLRREGKRVEVAAFRASTDEALIAAADAFVALDGRFRLNR